MLERKGKTERRRRKNSKGGQDKRERWTGREKPGKDKIEEQVESQL
jgi:hypothetical protein